MRKITVAVTQVALKGATSEPFEVLRDRMLDAHAELVGQAASRGVNIIGFQEVFNQAYFCPSRDPKWFACAESIPDGHTVRFVSDLARRYGMVIVAPIYEIGEDGNYYCAAAVIDADGRYLGKYRKVHIRNAPTSGKGIERLFFSSGNLGYPVFQTRYGRVGIYICFDRHFPEGFRALALNGAEVVFNPAATSVNLSEYIWRIEQPAAAVANGFYVCTNNRVGVEEPWTFGRFYGSSYIVNPDGVILAMGGRDNDELVLAEIDLNLVDEARRRWNIFETRQASTYASLMTNPEPLASVRGAASWKVDSEPG